MVCAQHVNKHQSGSAGSVLKNGIVMVAIPTDTLFLLFHIYRALLQKASVGLVGGSAIDTVSNIDRCPTIKFPHPYARFCYVKVIILQTDLRGVQTVLRMLFAVCEDSNRGLLRVFNILKMIVPRFTADVLSRLCRPL